MNKEQLIKPIIILLIVFCASIIMVRSFTGGQTISEYAYENNIPSHPEEPVNESGK